MEKSLDQHQMSETNSREFQKWADQEREVSEWNEQAIISRALVKAQADRLPDSGLDKGYERA